MYSLIQLSYTYHVPVYNVPVYDRVVHVSIIMCKYHHRLFNSYNHCIHSCSSVWQALVIISFSGFHYSIDLFYGQNHLVWLSNCCKGLYKNVVTKTRNGLFHSILFWILHPETIQYLSLDPQKFDLGIPNPKSKLLLITGNYEAFCSVPFRV